MYVGLIHLEKAYDRVNREALCQVVGKLLSGIKSMYVDSSACVRGRSGEDSDLEICAVCLGFVRIVVLVEEFI